MRLAAFNPMLHWSPDAVGYTHQLELDCPSCGPQYRLLICCVIGSPPGTAGVWGLTVSGAPSGDGWDGVSLAPSFQNNNHGRKKPCAVHFSIANGEVIP